MKNEEDFQMAFAIDTYEKGRLTDPRFFKFVAWVRGASDGALALNTA